MKKMLISITGIIVILFIADRLIACGLEKSLVHSKAALDIKIKDVVKETSAEVVFMGSSRTNSHFVPTIIEDSLNMSVYNAAFDGCMDVFFQYATLNLMLKRYVPKMIVLEIGDCVNGTSKRMPLLAPFIGESAETDQVFKDLNIYREYAISHCYRYNTSCVRSVGGLFFGTPQVLDKGYNPLANPSKGCTMDKVVQNEFKKDQLAMDYLVRFIKKCQSKKIKLILCASPWYAKTSPNLYAHIDQLAEDTDVPFLDYHTTGLYADSVDLWYDANHLSDKGAKKFSKRFVHDLKIRLKL